MKVMRDQNNGQTGDADGQPPDGDKSAGDGGDAAGSGVGDGAAEPAVTTEVEAPKQEEPKPPAEPDLSEFDLDELADDNQHSGSLGRGQFVSTAARVAEVDAFEDRNAVLASRLSELALAATARRPRLLADVRPYVRCHRVTVRRSTGARGDRSAEGTYVA
jgi:hypothetical protein